MATLAVRNNNPGNIKNPGTGSFRSFSDPDEGYAALLNDLQAKKAGNSSTGLGPNSTLMEFAAAYAPASDKNDPDQYAANIANHMGVRPDAKLSELDVGKWANAVAHAEDSNFASGYNPKPFSNPAPGSALSGLAQTKLPEPSGVTQNFQAGNYGAAALGAAKAVGGLVQRGAMAVAKPFVGLAAIPVQAAAKAFGAPDPYRRALGSQEAPPVEVSPLEAGAKAKDALHAAEITGTVAAGAGLVSALRGASALSSPVLEQELANDGLSMERFSAMSNAEKLNTLSDTIRSASASGKLVMQKAIEELTPLAAKELGVAPSLVLRVVRAVGSRIGKYAIGAALGAEGMKIYNWLTGSR